MLLWLGKETCASKCLRYKDPHVRASEKESVGDIHGCLGLASSGGKGFTKSVKAIKAQKAVSD